MFARNLLILALSATIVGAQAQPNSAAASLTVDGVNGPTYPTLVNIRNNTMSTWTVSGGPTRPYAIAQTYGDLVATPTVLMGAGYVHLPLAPLPNVFMDGFSQPLLHSIPPAGFRVFPVTVPPPGNSPSGIPVGTMLGFQAILQDPTSFFGLTLTAAIRTTVTTGPTVLNMQIGDEAVVPIALPPGMLLPFYGLNFTTAFVTENGYMTFGTGIADFTPSPQEFEVGPSRISGFWCDLVQHTGTIRATIDASPPTTPAYLKLEYINVQDWSLTGFPHTFSYMIDTSGFVSITHPANNPVSIFDVIVGITKGGGAWPAAVTVAQAKDLSVLQDGGGLAGATFESFGEWFGLTTMPYYTYGVNRPYDLAGRTLHFAPNETTATTTVGHTAKYLYY